MKPLYFLLTLAPVLLFSCAKDQPESEAPFAYPKTFARDTVLAGPWTGHLVTASGHTAISLPGYFSALTPLLDGEIQSWGPYYPVQGLTFLNDSLVTLMIQDDPGQPVFDTTFHYTQADNVFSIDTGSPGQPVLEFAYEPASDRLDVCWSAYFYTGFSPTQVYSPVSIEGCTGISVAAFLDGIIAQDDLLAGDTVFVSYPTLVYQ